MKTIKAFWDINCVSWRKGVTSCAEEFLIPLERPKILIVKRHFEVDEITKEVRDIKLTVKIEHNPKRWQILHEQLQ